MIYTKLTCEAMKIAYRAHHGQVDKGGLPYIFHPYHLAEQMHDEYSTCVALLHDVLEDTGVTLVELSEIFPREVVEAVAVMTHPKSEPYMDYIRRVKENPVAKAVKLEDLRHNSDQTRMQNADKDKLSYFRDKYRQALAVLEE